jgi:sulfoxide reductase heme-binding subunit YedZ
MARRPGPFEGPILLAWAALGLAALAGAAVAAHGPGEPGVRATIRATAASSLALLLLAFSASSLRRLVRGSATAWLLRNRRQVGLAMALSHGLHLAAIVTLVVGSLGYLALAALVVTSSDRAVAWLGHRRWRALHRGGCWVLWAVFLLSYAPGAASSPGHALAVGLLVAVAVLRWWGRLAVAPQARSGPSSGPAAPNL